MHLKSLHFLSDRYPTADHYPFNVPIFRRTDQIDFTAPVTMFVGENGTGKSTLLRAIAAKCNIHIWEGVGRARFRHNPYEREMHRYIDVRWASGPVPGSFFASEIFRNFAANLDEWASTSPSTLEYFGGTSLMEQSHGQCHLSFFRSRYRITGLYLLDEPENALSPGRQLELLQFIGRMGAEGHAQFIVATHSPILLALPAANLLSFDAETIRGIAYEDTEHFRVYREFINHREKFL